MHHPAHQMVPHPVDTLFSRDLAAIFRAQQKEYESIAPKNLRTIVLFGASWLGQTTAERLKHFPQQVEIFFADNNPKVTGDVNGIPVLRPEEAIARFGDSALFVVTIFHSDAVLRQLKQAGCKHVMTYVTLFRGHPTTLMPQFALDNPSAIIEDEADIRRLYDLFADDESRQEFLGILNWHTSEHYYFFDRLHPSKETYFAPDIISLSAHERFVDCGAYDGDTIRYILQRTGDAFERIAAFEPIASNFAMLNAFRDSLPPGISSKIDTYPFATSSSKQTLRFSANATASSQHYGERTETVQAERLDDVLREYHPTYIKMDIEGAEPDALRGASRILTEDAPKLAICLYHEIRHLWQIPLLILALNPEYKIYLRRYAPDCWETVCYAVKPSGSLR